MEQARLTLVQTIVREANYDEKCAGIITWCHTFSPSKMWINGFANLQKPYCHFATQYNLEIPNHLLRSGIGNLLPHFLPFTPLFSTFYHLYVHSKPNCKIIQGGIFEK